MYLQKVISKKTFLILWHLEGPRQKEQDLDQDPDIRWYGSATSDPDPYQNVTDPQHTTHFPSSIFLNNKKILWDVWILM
jgi:hypothetical protein